MQEQSWETQYWCNFTLSRPIISPPKKDKPTPASAPPCNTRNCPTPLSTQPITWNRTNHIDPIRYVWRQTDAHGGQIDTDNLQQPLLGDPILTPDELELGENKFYVYSIETTDVENTSDEILVATVHFDPDAPVVTMTGPTWIKPGQTINITAPIDDTALSSGLQAYTQTTQLNTNPGAVNVTTGDPYTFNATAVFNESVPQNAQHNDTYTFKLDVQDYALNTTSLHHSVKVDAQAPTLVTSEHPIWTNQTSPSFKWKVHDEGIGIQSVTIEQRPAGGTWSALHTYPVNALNDYEGIVTLTALQDESIYEIRYTMTDALDNQSTDIKTIKTDFTPPTATIPDISDPGDTVIYIPEGWTDIALTGNDPPRTSGKPTSGIMYYELRYGLPARINGNKTTDRGSVETPILPPWIGSTVIAYRHPPYVHFNGPNTGQYVFSLRAYDWAGNRSAWSEPTLPYQFGTDDTGYYSDTYTESYLPFFRPKRVPLPTAPPDRETVQQRGVDTPYPLPENEIKE